jgi:hypothetical protein
MNVTPEIVRAEMDYRVERARKSAVLGQARRVRGGWFHRLREHSGEQSGGRPTAVNGASFAA